MPCIGVNDPHYEHTFGLITTNQQIGRMFSDEESPQWLKRSKVGICDRGQAIEAMLEVVLITTISAALG